MDVITHGGPDRVHKVCRCSICGCQEMCTLFNDFYTPKGEPEGPLMCERCVRAGRRPTPKVVELDMAIADLQAICNSCGETVVLEIAQHAADILGRLQRALPGSLNKRRCFACGSVAYHADNRTPYVLCHCGSQDTRLVKGSHENP